jgi:hypothetical protein
MTLNIKTLNYKTAGAAQKYPEIPNNDNFV